LTAADFFGRIALSGSKNKKNQMKIEQKAERLMFRVSLLFVAVAGMLLVAMMSPLVMQ
jgi:hypothetical protein